MPLPRFNPINQAKRGLFTSASRKTPLSFYEKFRGAIITVGAATGGVLLYGYYRDSSSAIHQYAINPLMRFFLDPETAHRVSILGCKYGLGPKSYQNDDEKLAVKVWGHRFANPVGISAGYDKHAEAIDPLFDLGFGLVEIGSVTPKPQEGNPLPRFFRLSEDKSVINRYGFNSDGHDTVEERLQRRFWGLLRASHWESSSRELKDPNYSYNLQSEKSGHKDKWLGVNLGKNKASPAESNQDYVDGVHKLGPYADYLVINISSPNTPGLRDLQKTESLRRLIKEAQDARNTLPSPLPPLLVKIAPDLSDEEAKDISSVLKDLKVDGVIISNTTISRPSTLKSGLTDPKTVAQVGGLSGPPVKPLAVSLVKKIYSLTEGKVPIVGCGGISSGQDAVDFAKAGASLVQFYTHLGYRGPGAVDEIKREVTELLEKENTTWEKIIGQDHRN